MNESPSLTVSGWSAIAFQYAARWLACPTRGHLSQFGDKRVHIAVGEGKHEPARPWPLLRIAHPSHGQDAVGILLFFRSS
jgi:hypothetical protein